MTPNIAITDSDRPAVSKILAAMQADEAVLSAKTRHCHWNVTGPHFSELHRLFEAQYNAIEDTIMRSRNGSGRWAPPLPGR